MTAPPLQSIPHVAEVSQHVGAAAAADGAPDLVLETPHGATRARHFEALAAELRGPFPGDLLSFFFVNTDVGAPEVADALAARVVEEDPTKRVVVVRCLIPRTFIDCNRLVDRDATPRASKPGEVTPGLAPYARDPADVDLLLTRYLAYRDLVLRTYEAVCGAGGVGMMLHTYAPRQVNVAVDDDIVESLRAAYAPDRVDTWPLRPEIDLIARTQEGTCLASESLAEAVLEVFAEDGLEVADGRTYPLHPSTMAHALATQHPGQTLCLEMRRDLLVETFTPFAEMIPVAGKVARMASGLAKALSRTAAGARPRR